MNSITKKHATVALSGDGGDESFLGYNHFDKIHNNKWLFELPLLARKIIGNPIVARLSGKNPKIVRIIMGFKNIQEFIKSTFLSLDPLI